MVGVSDIDWVRLRNDHGIRGICFDKDNTITAPYSPNIHLSVSVKLQQICYELLRDFILILFRKVFRNARKYLMVRWWSFQILLVRFNLIPNLRRQQVLPKPPDWMSSSTILK